MSKVVNKSIVNFIKPVTRKGEFRTKDLQKADVVLHKAINPCCSTITFTFGSGATAAQKQFIVKNEVGAVVFKTDRAGGASQTAELSDGLYTVSVESFADQGNFLQVLDAHSGIVIHAADAVAVFESNYGLTKLTASYAATIQAS